MNKIHHTYQDLPESFYQRPSPRPFAKAQLILFNNELNDQFQIFKDQKEALDNLSFIHLSKNFSPVALAYAGHQFGHYVPQLGDGRALLLGEVKDSENTLYDIHLKGSGSTAFSRRGDGLCALGPALREYIVSEAMHALNISTTRALAVYLTGDKVIREQLHPGAVITRMAQSHIRVGTFEYFYYQNKFDDLKQLADYTLSRLYPNCLKEKNPYLSLFEQVAHNQLNLVSKWQSIGFIHGVMNTDNTNLSGETIDYGPCAFMDAYKKDKVFSSIDRFARYSYENQSNIILWNLSAFAQTLMPLIDKDQNTSMSLIQEKLEGLKEIQSSYWLKHFAKKIGILNPNESDEIIMRDYLMYLEKNKLDFTNSFRELSKEIKSDHSNESTQKVKAHLLNRSIDLDEAQKVMLAHNPYLIPRNHQVEKAIQLALKGDYSYSQRLVTAYSSPFQENLDFEDLTKPPKGHEIVHNTFCGT